MLVLWTLWACAEERIPYDAWVIDPDEGCVRPITVEGPPEGGCVDIVVVKMADDGSCWQFGCRWDDLPVEDIGGSGPPADPDWCRDSDWFSDQPRCGEDTDR